MQQTGIGVMIRDAEREFYAVQAKVFSSLLNPFVAEALGAWLAVKLGCDLGLSHVYLEGDSLNVVKCLEEDWTLLQ